MGFWQGLWQFLITPILVLVVVLTSVPVWIWLERRLCARIQQRIGPNRVGYQGLLQPLADAAKLLFKEDITPQHVDRIVYLCAPVLALIPSIAALAVIPFGPLQVADVNVGVLWVVALSSLAVYGVVLAGWSSNNKWSLMGGIRSAAQMVSYELGMGLAIVAVLLTSSAWAGHLQPGADGLVPGALSLKTAVLSQQGFAFLGWNCLWHFPAFVVFLIAAVAESNRAPFDLPEAEQELVAGFHTEYSSFRFAMFYMGEYIHMTTLSAVCTCLFLGGSLSPFAGIPGLAALNVSHVPVLNWLAPLGWFYLKVTIFICLYIWLRWTMPRMRWDQLMRLGWIVLLPVGLAWVGVTALLQGLGVALGDWLFSPVGWFRLLVAVTAGAVGFIMWRKKTAKA